MGEKKCGTCVEPVRGNDYLNCYGVCGRSFHFTCIADDDENRAYKKLMQELLPKFPKKIPNFQWYCDTCLPLSVNGIITTLSDCAGVLHSVKDWMANTPATLSVPGTSNGPMNSHSGTSIESSPNDTEMADAQGANNDGQHLVAPVVDLTEADGPASRIETCPGARRKRKLTVDSDAQPMEAGGRLKVQRVDATDVQGTPGGASASNQSVKKRRSIFPTPKPVTARGRTLYISGFKPSIEAQEITDFLRDAKIGDMDRITCTKLVSSYRKQRNLSYVSFKIWAPEDLYGLIADRKIWPRGITFREFLAREKSAAKAPPKHFLREERRSKHRVEEKPRSKVSNRREQERARMGAASRGPRPRGQAMMPQFNPFWFPPYQQHPPPSFPFAQQFHPMMTGYLPTMH